MTDVEEMECAAAGQRECWMNSSVDVSCCMEGIGTAILHVGIVWRRIEYGSADWRNLRFLAIAALVWRRVFKFWKETVSCIIHSRK